MTILNGFKMIRAPGYRKLPVNVLVYDTAIRQDVGTQEYL